MTEKTRNAGWGGLALSVALSLAGSGAFATDDTPVWSDVSEIFQNRCINCHSALGASRGLRLDSFDATLAGSQRGAVVLPGDSANSELVRRLRGESLPRMPFLSVPLPPEELDLIVRWIDAGLPDTAPSR